MLRSTEQTCRARLRVRYGGSGGDGLGGAGRYLNTSRIVSGIRAATRYRAFARGPDIAEIAVAGGGSYRRVERAGVADAE